MRTTSGFQLQVFPKENFEAFRVVSLNGFQQRDLLTGVWRFVLYGRDPDGRVRIKPLTRLDPTIDLPRKKMISINGELLDADDLRPLPAGQSRLEKLPRPEVVPMIHKLAHAKNDPFAWRDLACGYRVKGMERPIQDALVKVGIEKVLFWIREMQKRGHDDWPPGVVAFLEEREAAAAKAKHEAMFKPTPWDVVAPDWIDDLP